MIAFDLPWVLWITPAVALLYAVLAWTARRARIRHAARWSPALRDQAVGNGRRGGVLLGLVAFFATVALAGPRFGGRTVTTETKALNLVIAVDISRSMLAEDVSPSRLEHVQQQAHRLVQDLAGDRLGLIVFAGGSWILSPLSVDAGAIRLLIDGLHPNLASRGGTSIARALNQGRELLLAGEGVADRVLVVFTDGEELDSVPAALEEARALGRDGVKLILVAVGGSEPARIPIRDPNGVLLGFQRDLDNNIVLTARRDDILSRVADAAGGAPFVSAEAVDQAGAVRRIVMGLKRSPQATTTAQQDVSRAWLPVAVAVLLLLFHTLTRRTAALAVLAGLSVLPARGSAQRAGNPADAYWRDGDLRRAALLYARQARDNRGGDTTWLNLGTAALALNDSAVARAALERASRSLDPEVRFRALYNLGLLDLRLARDNPAGREEHLDAARRAYRDALLLNPGDVDAKWNYELAARQSPPPSGDGGQQPPPPPPPQSGGEDPQPAPQGLTREQAEQILDSMLEEERQTRESVNQRRARGRSPRRRKDW